MTFEVYGYDKQTGAEITKIENETSTRYEKGNCMLHRDDGTALIRNNGTEEWHRNGQLHRIDGPAIERKDGTKEWFLLGIRHRDDGPAIEFSNGEKQWYWEGIKMDNEEEFIKFKYEDGGSFKKILDSHLKPISSPKQQHAALLNEELLFIKEFLKITDNSENSTKKLKI